MRTILALFAVYSMVMGWPEKRTAKYWYQRWKASRS